MGKPSMPEVMEDLFRRFDIVRRSAMYKSPHEVTVESFLDMLESLNDAIVAAGGTPIKTKDLRTFSATQLLCLLSPNGIRFSYCKGEGEHANI